MGFRGYSFRVQAAGIGAGIRHLNTFSGTQQDHKAGPVPVAFCGVGHDDSTELGSFVMPWCPTPQNPTGAQKKLWLKTAFRKLNEREKKGALDLRET